MSRSVNNASYPGQIDVTIYPYQDVASIDADQILLDIVPPGVMSAQISNTISGSALLTTIHAGTSFAFKKSFTTTSSPIYTREFIVKMIITDDIVLSNSLSSFVALTDESLVLIAAWDWEDTYTSGTNKYPTFIIKGSSDATVYTSYLQFGDLILCEFLDHAQVKGGTYAYPIAYQNIYGRSASSATLSKDYRSTFQRLHNSSNQFNIQFGKQYETYVGPVYKTPLYCVTGYGMIRDTAFSIDESTTGNVVPLETVPADQLGAGTYQVDVLRIVVTDDVANTPELQWTSVASNTYPEPITIADPLTIAKALKCLGNTPLPFVDEGIIVGIAIRTRANIGDGLTTGTVNALWPHEFVQWNPGIPYIGTAPTSTRVSIPLYTESEIDWS
jgi:hypothetical protein